MVVCAHMVKMAPVVLKVGVSIIVPLSGKQERGSWKFDDRDEEAGSEKTARINKEKVEIMGEIMVDTTRVRESLVVFD